MPAAIELEQPAPRAARRVGDQRARAPRRDRRIRVVERGHEPRDAVGVEGDDVGAREPGAQAGQCGAVQYGSILYHRRAPRLPDRGRADTMRRVRVLPIVMGIALSLGACSPIAVPIQLQPFPDVPVPAEWTPYSNDWVIIRTPKVTAARLIYFTTANVETTLATRATPARQRGLAGDPERALRQRGEVSRRLGRVPQG